MVAVWSVCCFLWGLYLCTWPVMSYLASNVATASAKGGLAPSACAYTVCSVCNLVMLMVERKAPVGEPGQPCSDRLADGIVKSLPGLDPGPPCSWC